MARAYIFIKVNVIGYQTILYKIQQTKNIIENNQKHLYKQIACKN